jgi:hypothetical protein
MRLLTLACFFAFSASAAAQSMAMTGMENTVGYLSAGTSIEPKTTSESSAMVHKVVGNWNLMLHANAFLVDIQQSGPRGGDKVFSANWVMPMFVRALGRHSLTFRPMVSLEPATVTQRRYPLLFQNGETAFGEEIRDGQHPHELFMELAGRYEYRITDRTAVFVYGGPVGDPALGPVAFPHRSSASENPMAPLGHHYQDSTHIANSVVTIGLIAGRVQLEASTFRGREPNENRWNIDGGKPDSFASRLTVAANNRLAAQFSIGRINNREQLEPDLDTLRTTASLHHNVPFSTGHVSSSLIWGRNKDVDQHGTRVFNAYGLESTVKFLQRNWAWTRIENLDREPPHEGNEPAGRIQAYTFGYERDVSVGVRWLNVGLGVQVTAFGIPPKLRPAYGDSPGSVAFFLRLRPTGNMMEHMRMMHQ